MELTPGEAQSLYNAAAACEAMMALAVTLTDAPPEVVAEVESLRSAMAKLRPYVNVPLAEAVKARLQ